MGSRTDRQAADGAARGTARKHAGGAAGMACPAPDGAARAQGDTAGMRLRASPLSSHVALVATRIDAQRRAFRRRWRKLLMKSWRLSRWHYSRYGMVLDGRPSDPV